jgi:hypothetical protein
MRRTRTTTSHRLAVGPSAIALIVVALLGSSAARAGWVVRNSQPAAPTPASASERSVERVHRRPLEHESAAWGPFLRATAPALTRVQRPGGAGADGPRSLIALSAERTTFELVPRPAPGGAVLAREEAVSSPGQPAPTSRAPPLG